MELRLPNSVVYAGGIINPALPEVGSGEGTEILGRILSTTVSLLLGIGLLASFLFLIIGAYKWIGAGGDKAVLIEARSRIIQALVGLFILFSIFAIIRTVGTIFGFNLIEISIPTVSS